MTRIAVFVLAVALSSLQAMAGDIYRRDSIKDTPAPTAFDDPAVNWTGVYIGAHGGYGNANHRLDVQSYSDAVICEKDCGEGVPDGSEIEPASAVSLGTIDGMNSSGLIGGARIGADMAVGRFLFGVFADYNLSDMKTELDIAAGDSTLSFGLEKQDEWSVGGRVGLIVAPRTMAYVLAAYTQTEYEVTGLGQIPLNDGQSLRSGATFDGVTVGGGIEFALAANVFLGAEYRHTFYGEESILDFHADGQPGGGVRVLDELDEDSIMATIKFKLNGLPQ
jgi:outer membrane immunogenic protein